MLQLELLLKSLPLRFLGLLLRQLLVLELLLLLNSLTIRFLLRVELVLLLQILPFKYRVRRTGRRRSRRSRDFGGMYEGRHRPSGCRIQPRSSGLGSRRCRA